MGWYPEGVREGGLHCNWFITLQNPKIKRKIFICCPCTFLYIFYTSRREKLSKVLTKFILCDHVFLYIFFFSDHCVSICTETKKNLTLGTLTDWTVKTLQKLYLNTNEPMKVNMMTVHVPPPPPKKKKQTTTTKLFVKPLKKEGAKSNKKNCKLLGKKPNQWPQKKKRHQCTLTPCSLKNSSTRNWCNSIQVAWSGCYLVATPKERKISIAF